jgi:anthranilate phosphoribosyltransferase
VANLAADMADGLKRARQAIASGAARRKLDELVSISARLAQASA